MKSGPDDPLASALASGSFNCSSDSFLARVQHFSEGKRTVRAEGDAECHYGRRKGVGACVMILVKSERL